MSINGELGRDCMVLILGGGRGTRLDPLTRLRSKPAVPIAGKYRLIDIPISNAINSKMKKMYVLTQFNSVSLHRHISRTYRFDSFTRGWVNILAAQQTPASKHWFQGTADAVRQYSEMIKGFNVQHVVILAGDHMYRMDYRHLLQDHEAYNADITIGVMPCSEEEISEFGAARVDESGRILEFREKPKTPEQRAGMEVSPDLLKKKGVQADQPYLASMGIYIFRKQALLEALDNDLVDFGGEIIPAEVPRRRVQAHFFKGYWRDIGTIRAFFDAHMDLVAETPKFDLYDQEWPFYTRARFLPGSRLNRCEFERTLLGEGSRVERTRTDGVIIGLRSKITGADLEQVLIMGVDSHYPDRGPNAPPVGIGEGTVIRNAIIDKNARIGRNVKIGINPIQNGATGEGWSVRDGLVVIEKNAVLPDGTVI